MTNEKKGGESPPAKIEKTDRPIPLKEPRKDGQTLSPGYIPDPPTTPTKPPQKSG